MGNKTFQSKRHYVLCKQLLNSTPEKIFPLLCPKMEYEWIEPWECNIIYSNSGFAEQDCIFSTEFPEDIKETWIVDRYEKDKVIQFIRFSEPRVIRYCISLFDNNNETTTAKWEQTITSLNEEGNLYVDNFSDEDYRKEIKILEKMLNYFLKTGKMMKYVSDNT